MDQLDLKKIESIIQYEFKNKKLLEQAFKVSETIDEEEEYSSEELRIIGIRVINYAPTYLLMDRYGQTNENGYRIDMDKNEVKDILDNLYSRYMYSRIIQTLGLSVYLNITDMDLYDDLSRRLFEAIIGAVTVDSDWNTRVFSRVLSYMLDIDYHLKYGFNSFENHYVIKVYNWCVENNKTLPLYQFVLVRNAKGQEYYRCSVKFGAETISETDKSKTLSKFKAAEAVYNKLVEAGYVIERDEDGYTLNELNVTEDDAVEYLKNLAIQNGWSEPTYDTIEEDNDLFVTICNIDEVTRQVESKGVTVENAMGKAALRMVKYVLGYRID